MAISFKPFSLLHDISQMFPKITNLVTVKSFPDTKFKQQKLPAWQPIMTAGTVLPAFFAIGIAFIPLGVALLITANNVI